MDNINKLIEKTLCEEQFNSNSKKNMMDINKAEVWAKAMSILFIGMDLWKTFIVEVI